MLTDKYKIMIMTASVGCGHDQAAKVVGKKLLEKNQDVEIRIVDFIDLFPSTAGQFIKNAYLKMIDKAPNWYNLLYKFTENLNNQGKVNSVFVHKYKKKVRTIIEDFDPHIILFTNPFPSTLVSHLKRRNKISTYTATVITDYTAHRVWLDSTIDSYFVGSNILKQEMVARGVSALKIHVTGIPVDEKFNIPINKKQTMKDLGLDANMPTILIMGGGLGLGSIEEILKVTDQIDKPLQLIVVAGKNEHLKYELENRQYNFKHNVRIFGFCNNIHELMECSHLLISKAGGLTMTEAITKKLPTLILDPIPGQEVKNARYLSYAGVAKYLQDIEETKSVVEELLYEKPYKREMMVRACSAIRRPNATEDISQFLLNKIDNMVYRKTPMVK